MRHLIIHRQRALMGFGLSYFCILDQTRDGFLARLEGLSRAECNALEGPIPITNGQTIKVPIDDQAHTFLIALYPEEKNMVTREIPVPAGAEDHKPLHFATIPFPMNSSIVTDVSEDMPPRLTNAAITLPQMIFKSPRKVMWSTYFTSISNLSCQLTVFLP